MHGESKNENPCAKRIGRENSEWFFSTFILKSLLYSDLQENYNSDPQRSRNHFKLRQQISQILPTLKLVGPKFIVSLKCWCESEFSTLNCNRFCEASSSTRSWMEHEKALVWWTFHFLIEKKIIVEYWIRIIIIVKRYGRKLNFWWRIWFRMMNGMNDIWSMVRTEPQLSPIEYDEQAKLILLSITIIVNLARITFFVNFLACLSNPESKICQN